MTAPHEKSDGIRVLVVNDNDQVRQLVMATIIEQTDMTAVGEALTGEDGVAVAQRLRPDVVVMDGAMPGMGGAWATQQILASLPEIRIVAFAGSPSTMEELLAAGAVAKVEKAAPLYRLLMAIRKA
jgi:two-component system invasion response regulator UvrY